MKKINSYISLALLTGLTPAFTFAASCNVSTVPGQETTLCGGGITIAGILKNITDWALGIIGAIAVLFIIWSGFQYITAGGNEKRVESAKQTITYAVIGLIVILLAKVIITLVGNTLGTLTTS